MALKYYFDLMSQPSRAVYIFLKANNIKFEAKPVALRKGEHFKEEFTKLNPWQRVPVLDDNGFILTESVAILRYLASKYNLPEHWYPKNDLQKQARIEEYLHWQHLNTRMQAAMVFQQKLIMPVARQGKIDEVKVNRFKAELPKIIEHIDQYFLKDGKYIGGNDDVSVADLLGACELLQLYPVFEEDIYETNKKVKQWMERVRERLNPYFDEGHGITYRTRETYKTLGPKLGAKL
ncbi:glutathione S-transferase theta-1-like isoform X1 [Mercenaria mercenaria]|uniref:glutathione S-transferase theta-1-like isoform X1 n=1 Tax=Mercenaria mercenaria TaxID=6596 RepID=UPI00234F592D|nr:glutathione S-transferase theta-1-like isoform X1 [Mercenaria mercenaria]